MRCVRCYRCRGQGRPAPPWTVFRQLLDWMTVWSPRVPLPRPVDGTWIVGLKAITSLLSFNVPRPRRVLLADLTHTGQVVASNVMPLGVGLIAATLLESEPMTSVEVFKYPDDLNRALLIGPPDVVGFANYSWNLDISHKFARRIREVYPETVIVFGGPNYGLDRREIKEFWERYPAIDFYVVREGESAFLALFRELDASGFSVEEVKRHPDRLVNCHYVLDGHVVETELAPRLGDLDAIPSPYVSGLMDKFFDNVLIPMIHTTRGCPFTCTFCTEGSKYYSKVAQRTSMDEELEYIAERRGTVPDLVITDANFGMFVQDREKALAIRGIQDRFGWPQRVIVSTGKNQKERIIEVADLLRGSMSVAASLQSTDSEVLANIKRSNISSEALQLMVEGANVADAPTYTEIILGLPGDSKAKHEKSLRDVTNLGLGIVRMYQLILLPQTELNSPDTRLEYAYETRFRVNPRSFGRYDVLGETVVAVEHEEIAVANSTLSFGDYLDCRELDLSVEILHNSGLFYELAALFRHFELPWFDLVVRVHDRIGQESGSLTRLYESYREDNLQGLFMTQDELLAHVEASIEDYLLDIDGTNEIAKAKAIAFSMCVDALHELVFSEAVILLTEAGLANADITRYLEQLSRYSRARKQAVLDTELLLVDEFSFDFVALVACDFDADPLDYDLNGPATLSFHHDSEQVRLIEGYRGQYSPETIDGLGRILMRANPKRLFRSVHSELSDGTVETLVERRPDQGLNVYGGFTVQ